uniref:Two-component response regulator n=1 Tax=uncultured bacterium pBF1 TaxID=1781162 RepID=A0A1C9U578_9BACT|nr:two-component response regulator [uncultured bacterium pBF1]
MKLYLVSSVDSVLEHWAKALKKYHPIKLKTINELNRPNEGIFFWNDETLFEEELEQILGCDTCRLMVFSTVPNFTKAQQLLASGVKGYGNAMMHESHLQSAYQAVEEGNIWLHPDFITMMISQIKDRADHEKQMLTILDVLSHREQEVALLLGDGKMHQEIADVLDITVRTVKAHATAIYQKLNVKDRLALSLLLHR